ncbi:MAG: YvrJ family protein [Ignavibacteriales bacterium]
MEDMLNQIGNYGFPIIVSAYLLIRMEAKLDQLVSTIGELKEAIIGLKG